MIYRRLGRTEIQVSAIGFGTEHLTGPQEEICSIVHEAVDQGINYFDLILGEPEYYQNYGHAFRGKRDRLVIAAHLDASSTNGQVDASGQCRKAFEEMLSQLQVDSVDVCLLQFIDELDLYERATGPGGTFELAHQLKQEGKIRSIGMSSHMVPASLRAVQEGVIDVLMFSINPAFDALPGYIKNLVDLWEWSVNPELHVESSSDQFERKSLYKACATADVGLVAMKPYAAGFLFKPFIYQNSSPLTPIQCLSYALAQPGVSTVVPGISTHQHLREALSTLQASEAERDYGPMIAATQWNIAGQCMYCNHCLPCPAGIDIAETLRLIDSAMQTNSGSLQHEYRSLQGSALDCIECGQCMKRCPFGVQVIEKMKQGQRLFE